LWGLFVEFARERGRVTVAGPVDLLSWNERLQRFAARPDLKAKQKIIWLRGETTSRARLELTKLGWTVKENAIKTKSKSSSTL
jgi:hypothetical protein